MSKTSQNKKQDYTCHPILNSPTLLQLFNHSQAAYVSFAISRLSIISSVIGRQATQTQLIPELKKLMLKNPCSELSRLLEIQIHKLTKQTDSISA